MGKIIHSRFIYFEEILDFSLCSSDELRNALGYEFALYSAAAQCRIETHRRAPSVVDIPKYDLSGDERLSDTSLSPPENRPGGPLTMSSMETDVEMDFEKARFNMVEQQIRPWDVLNQRVLDMIGEMPREDFVPAAFRKLAFADTQIPLDDGQVMMPPREEARLIQMLALRGDEHVLEIGTGSGYLTALLAKSARRVTTVEISPTLHGQASEKLKAQGLGNVNFILADGLEGWPKDAPYDAIAVTGSVPELDKHFQRQLKPAGRLFVVVGEAPAMEALLITRVGADDWARESHFETVLPSLTGARQSEEFEL